MRRIATPVRTFCACLLILFADAAHSIAAWSQALEQEVARIDQQSPGALGVYVKRLSSGETFSRGGEQLWYLGSTVKVPVAIAVLQQVDAGKLKLADRIKLQDTDKIEAGSLVWITSGATFTVKDLLRRMVVDSDNTAANMLIRLVGEKQLNESARGAMGGDNSYQPITTLAQVRYDVYSELHGDALKLSNSQLVQIAAAPLGPKRVAALRRTLGISNSELKVKTIDEAYARYYKTGRNSATLQAYGKLLESLVKGKLLSPQSTRLLFEDMKIDIFTNYRLQAGLPRSVKFIHKTGTQYQTACHSGVINPQDGGADAIVVAACTAGIDEQHDAGKVLEAVGRAITRTLLQDQSAAAPR
jgi:beta-lactamase class A